jgi:multisubunit Na+/H+ antiporter MnhB subunit
MQWPLRNKKIRGITAIVLFLIIGLALLFFAQHESPEEKAIREWAGGPKRTLWPLYVALIGGACTLYILFFRVEERRKKYLGMLLPAVYFFCLILLPSRWNWA